MNPVLFRYAIRPLGAASATAALLAAQPAAAHHSYGMYDLQKERTLTGEVTAFEWTNPHSWVGVKASDARGGSQVWRIEMGPPGQLVRTGWKRNSLKAGDMVTITIRPLRDGAAGGHLLSATTSSGAVLYDTIFRAPPAAGSAAP